MLTPKSRIVAEIEKSIKFDRSKLSLRVMEVIEFRKSLLLWYRLVRESNLKPFKKMALLIRKYREEIESHITSRLTSAKSEGINNKLKGLRRSAYGYTNETSYLNKILQRCGYLNSTHIDTAGWFWGSNNSLAQNTPF